VPSDFDEGVGLMSFRGAVALTAGVVSFLVHLKILWIGCHDRGFAAMRLGVERRVEGEPRLMPERYMDNEDLASEDDRRDASPKMVRRARRLFKNLSDVAWFQAPAETVAAIVLVAAWIYGSYQWIYRVDHKGVGIPLPARPELSHDLPVNNGEASTDRDAGGRFVFDVTVNGLTMPMIYDDDIPLVTIRAKDALRLGISFARLDFASKIKTGKGLIEVAGITINSMTVGSITYRLVPGFVARSGTLDENILGHSFLGRLPTYRFENGRIILTGPR
jgi:aspartyl protease family protein